MHPNVDTLGKWPISGDEARKAKRLIPIRSCEQLPLIHGQRDHVLFSFIVSNDYMNVGILQIPPGKYSEVERHEGDEALYLLEGDLVIRLVDEEQPTENQALFDGQHVCQGEKCLIPEGQRHQYINFTDKMVRAFIAIGPRL